MARPLRIEYAGAFYHVTSRGNERKNIFLDKRDFEQFLEILSMVIEREHWRCYAYCLMSNHYHLLIETPGGKLSKGMRQLNGVFTQAFNRRHSRVGHLFQGRYKAILVESDAYLKELSRYVVLNPVRAEMVRFAEDWPWSSYRQTSLRVQPQAWLAVDALLSQFGADRKGAISAYETYVKAGAGLPSPWKALKNQIYLGSDEFVEDAQCKMGINQPLQDIPRIQKNAPIKSLAHYAVIYSDPKLAMAMAYESNHYTLEQIARYFGVGRMTVSRAYRRHCGKRET